MFGSERVLRGGLRVYSTYDPLLQRAAEQAIRARIAEIGKARRGAKRLQGSLVAIDPSTGDVVALVGGRNFDESPFNRATQARRQAGSAFKPIIYAAALERGYAPGTVLRGLDTPIADSGGAWLPAGEHENNEYTLRRALKVSSNRAAAQLLQQVGVSTAVYYAHRLGIGSELPKRPVARARQWRSDATRADGGVQRLRESGSARCATFSDACRGRRWHCALVGAVRDDSRHQSDDGVPDVEHAGGRSGQRDGNRCASGGFQAPGGRQNRNNRRLLRRLVRRVYAASRGRRLVRVRRARPHHESGLRRRCRRSRLGAVHESGDNWRAPRLVRDSGRRGEGCYLPHHRCPRDRRLPARHCDFAGAPALAGLGLESWSLPVAPLPNAPAEPNVYEDYFPLGTISPDLCPLHGAVAETAPATPILAPASYPARRIVIERTLRNDGTAAIAMKGGGD